MGGGGHTSAGVPPLALVVLHAPYSCVGGLSPAVVVSHSGTGTAVLGSVLEPFETAIIVLKDI